MQSVLSFSPFSVLKTSGYVPNRRQPSKITGDVFLRFGASDRAKQDDFPGLRPVPDDQHKNIQLLLRKLGLISTEKPGLYQMAMTHGSFARLNNLPYNHSYQRLEYMGDAMVLLLAREYLCRQYPDLRENGMGVLEPVLCCNEFLAEVAAGLKIDRHIICEGTSQNVQDIRRSKNVLADIMESLLGAMYLDGKVDEARTLMEPWFEKKRSMIEMDGMVSELLQKQEERLKKKQSPPHPIGGGLW